MIVILICLVPLAFVVVTLLVRFIFSFWQCYCKSKVCLVGKTALVVGGSGGIGYQIVLGLASRGCRVIIADCNVDESIIDAIYKETNNSNISLRYINMASFKSVREFAANLKTVEDKLDIVINNAGVGYGLSVRTEDELGITMQVNYYSAFLLTHLLIDLLKTSSAGGRLIFTSSLLSFLHPLNAEHVEKNGIETGYEVVSYPISKYCQISASEVFAEKLEKYRITSNCFHPYTARTNLYDNIYKGAKWYECIMIRIMQTIVEITGKTPEEAAQTGIFLACANEVQNVSGKFFGEMKSVRKPPGINDEKLRKAIWEQSEKVVKLQPSERII